MTSKHSENSKYTCIREQQLSQHEAEITALKTRADYKEQQIHELNKSMHEMSEKLDDIKDDLQGIILKSIQDDADIDNRVTALENTVKVLKWISGFALSFLTVTVTVLAFAITHLH